VVLIVHSTIFGSVSSIGGSAGVNCDPDPRAGGPDNVRGQKLGQCAGL
jgi:hypothetical protein